MDKNNVENILKDNMEVLDNAIRAGINFKITPKLETREEFLNSLNEIPTIVLNDAVNDIILVLVEKRNKEIQLLRNIEEFKDK